MLGILAINTKNTKRKSKCEEMSKVQDVKQTVTRKNLARKLRSSIDWLALQAIFLYWVLTWLSYPAFFGFNNSVVSLGSSNGIVFAGSYLRSVYFLFCATCPLVAILYIFHSYFVILRPVTACQKATVFTFLLMTIENVLMAFDALSNLHTSKALLYIDSIIQGPSASIVPFGLSDILLVVILLTSTLYILLCQESH
jgi:hypothetical protein